MQKRCSPAQGFCLGRDNSLPILALAVVRLPVGRRGTCCQSTLCGKEYCQSTVWFPLPLRYVPGSDLGHPPGMDPGRIRSICMRRQPSPRRSCCRLGIPHSTMVRLRRASPMPAAAADGWAADLAPGNRRFFKSPHAATVKLLQSERKLCSPSENSAGSVAVEALLPCDTRRPSADRPAKPKNEIAAAAAAAKCSDLRLSVSCPVPERETAAGDARLGQRRDGWKEAEHQRAG